MRREREIVSQLGPGIWQFQLYGIEPNGVNAYLIDDGELTLIDVGMFWDTSLIHRGLEAIGRSVEDLDRILLTHYDVDHVGGLYRMTGLDVEIYLGHRDLEVLSSSTEHSYQSHKHCLHRFLSRVLSVPRGTRPVEDGERIGNFTAYHTPGHNPGHMAYVHREVSAAILGDVAQSVDGELRPMYWFDSYNFAESKRSIKTLAARIPSVDIVGTGHGTPITHAGHDELQRLARTV